MRTRERPSPWSTSTCAASRAISRVFIGDSYFIKSLESDTTSVAHHCKSRFLDALSARCASASARNDKRKLACNGRALSLASFPRSGLLFQKQRPSLLLIVLSLF